MINKNSMSNPLLRTLASAINVAGGGVAFDNVPRTTFADGGFVSRNISRDVISNSQLNLQMKQILSNLPTPIVTVEAISKGLSNKAKVKQRATL